MAPRPKCPAKRRRAIYADDFKTLANRVRRIELLIAFMLGAQVLTLGARAGEWIGLWR